MTTKVIRAGFEAGPPQDPALTISGRAQPAEDVHQRRLPGAAVAQQRRDLPLVDVKGQICSQGTETGVSGWDPGSPSHLLPQDQPQCSHVGLYSHPMAGLGWPHTHISKGKEVTTSGR